MVIINRLLCVSAACTSGKAIALREFIDGLHTRGSLYSRQDLNRFSVETRPNHSWSLTSLVIIQGYSTCSAFTNFCYYHVVIKVHFFMIRTHTHTHTQKKKSPGYGSDFDLFSMLILYVTNQQLLNIFRKIKCWACRLAVNINST